MYKCEIEFTVVAVSENTNSFGLKQMIMDSGSGVKAAACFNSLNVKKVGDKITGNAWRVNGSVLSVQFPGGELPELF